MTQDETKELQKYFSATFSNDSFGNTTIKEFLDSGYLNGSSYCNLYKSLQ
jgi:threonine synthase